MFCLDYNIPRFASLVATNNTSRFQTDPLNGPALLYPSFILLCNRDVDPTPLCTISLAASSNSGSAFRHIDISSFLHLFRRYTLAT
jgi:hypothetical protein